MPWSKTWNRNSFGILTTTHGHTKNRKTSKTYNSWASMKARCRTRKHNRTYRMYVLRGITVCDRWMKFENFLEDMGERPEGRSIDRIDNNGNYEPSNCRWATNDEQVNNRRVSKYIEFNGQKLTITQWARKLGMERGAIKFRVKNWGIQRALTTQKRGAK